MAQILRANGTRGTIEPHNGTDFTLDEVRAIVGGRVELISLYDGRIMLINEEGKLHDLPLNVEATRLFLVERGGDDVIVGDALVCEDAQFQ
jgi:hypothetical protein